MPVSRFLTAAALLPVCIGALLFLPNFWWSLLLLVVLAAAGLEWARLAGFSRSGTWMFVSIAVLSYALLAGMTGIEGTDAWHTAALWLAAVFWVAMAPVWLAVRARPRTKGLLAVAGWVVLVPAAAAIAGLQQSPVVLLVLLGVVWVADSAAYYSGRRFGKRRLAPEISPGKTWEGIAGAVLAVTVYYGTLHALAGSRLPGLADGAGALLFAIVMVSSVEGDLYESWIKRQAGVKDSGTLLPGHGGVLDRIDGLTSSMPLAALWCQYSSFCLFP